jgi:hypothetical protein
MCLAVRRYPGAIARFGLEVQGRATPAPVVDPRASRLRYELQVQTSRSQMRRDVVA